MSTDLFEAFGGPSTSRSASGTESQPYNQQTGFDQAARSEPQEARRNQRPEEPLWKPSQGGNDVLFDATDEEGDQDDFGDFEDPIASQHAAQTPRKEDILAPTKPARPAGELIDLLSLDDPPADLSTMNDRSPANISVSLSTAQVQRQDAEEDDGWGDFEGVVHATANDDSSRPTTSEAWSSVPAPTQGTVISKKPESDDEWADFEDGPMEAVRAQPSQVLQPTHRQAAPFPSSPTADDKDNDDDDWAPFDDPPHPGADQNKALAQPPQSSQQPTPSSIPPSAQRPTNIPPPSILASWLTQLYPLPTSTSPADPGTILLLHTLTARIIGGRTLRWRRDTLLSQSLRISDTTTTSATARASGGMKLSSLSKSETARESREASETVAAWNALVPRYQAILRDAGARGVKTPSVKGLRLVMPMAVKTLGSAQGGMEATYICPVCGLRRSERVVGVDDVGVEDVFGEFWREGWGHTGCAEGWYRWNGGLGQR